MFSLLEGNTSLLITRRQFALYHLVCLASQDIFFLILITAHIILYNYVLCSFSSYLLSGKKNARDRLQALLAALDRFLLLFTVFPFSSSKCLEVIVKKNNLWRG
ncbi:hypothetical protein WN48_08918 [Eufriesea mexicana]|uniref:Uncharacterized protein n=1 Tax=Eufriesea mexicana TaxID=516756 RepID=A0A310SU63_9HYME|nr:hypothetical protein WN48_08918 [Eufriesea mexicana]